MKSLSRILTVCLCCVPVYGATAAPVATTAGNNLTAYNPSNAYNNQWATVSNARYDGNTTAKVDFGNCNAVILRCAQPKCGNGGCVDESVASAIVAGCVRSNNQCKQYGDDLIEYMTAQLVANSNAKINQQNMALEQARLQAEANAAAASAQSEQISQMQNQMAQMQQQMYQQQQESAQQLQEALAQQAAQSQAAIESMKAAATDAAKQTEAGISAYQQDAINRGISEDVLARQQITGQIQTEIEDADTSLIAMKKAMQNAFDYAGCDARGNNCNAPRRIKKWRELATGFLTPYDNTIDKIYDALVTAQTVGVDLTDIYMMLNNSCNSWGQYMCQPGTVLYAGKNGTPVSCPESNDKTSLASIGKCLSEAEKNGMSESDCYKRECYPCTLLKVLTDKAEVYEGWINTTITDDSNRTVVACASSALDSAKLFTRRTKNKNGAGLVDIDLLDRWLNQTEPTKKLKDVEPQEYCSVTDETFLESKVLSRSVNTEDKNQDFVFCVDKAGGNKYDSDCPFIAPLYAICDTHPFNAGITAANWIEKTSATEIAEDKEKMNHIIGLKITVISQQMYKQYEYLNATLRRLKTQLQKAVLTANLEAAGAKSEDGGSSGLLGGGKDSAYKNCSGKDIQEAIYCLRENYSALESQVSKKKCNSAIKEQMAKDLTILDGKIPNNSNYNKISENCKKKDKITKCDECLEEYSNGLNTLDDVRLDREARRQGRYRD